MFFSNTPCFFLAIIDSSSHSTVYCAGEWVFSSGWLCYSPAEHPTGWRGSWQESPQMNRTLKINEKKLCNLRLNMCLWQWLWRNHWVQSHALILFLWPYDIRMVNSSVIRSVGFTFVSSMAIGHEVFVSPSYRGGLQVWIRDRESVTEKGKRENEAKKTPRVML